jgi:hypothetical protein
LESTFLWVPAYLLMGSGENGEGDGRFERPGGSETRLIGSLRRSAAKDWRSRGRVSGVASSVRDNLGLTEILRWVHLEASELGGGPTTEEASP